MLSFDDKVEIRFRVKPIVRKNFDMALELLKKNEDEAFEEFVSYLISQALRKEDDSLSDEVVSGRIRKWFNHPDGLPYKMLKAFLTVSHNMNRSLEEPVDRFKMSGYFKVYANCDEDKFDSIFRQMCSASKRAYGNVFKYNRNTREVTLSKEYINLVSSLDDIDC